MTPRARERALRRAAARRAARASRRCCASPRAQRDQPFRDAVSLETKPAVRPHARQVGARSARPAAPSIVPCSGASARGRRRRRASAPPLHVTCRFVMWPVASSACAAARAALGSLAFDRLAQRASSLDQCSARMRCVRWRRPRGRPARARCPSVVEHRRGAARRRRARGVGVDRRRDARAGCSRARRRSHASTAARASAAERVAQRGPTLDVGRRTLASDLQRSTIATAWAESASRCDPRAVAIAQLRHAR